MKYRVLVTTYGVAEANCVHSIVLEFDDLILADETIHLLNKDEGKIPNLRWFKRHAQILPYDKEKVL